MVVPPRSRRRNVSCPSDTVTVYVFLTIGSAFLNFFEIPFVTGVADALANGVKSFGQNFRAIQSGQYLVVQVDTNADKAADFSVAPTAELPVARTVLTALTIGRPWFTPLGEHR